MCCARAAAHTVELRAEKMNPAAASKPEEMRRELLLSHVKELSANSTFPHFISTGFTALTPCPEVTSFPPFPITWPAHLFPLSFHQPCSKDTGPFPHIPCKVVFSAPALVFQPFFFVCLPSFWISLPVLMSTMWTFIFLLVFETYSGSKPGYLLSLYSPGVSLKENGVRFLLLFCLVLRSFLVVCLLWIH